MRCAITVAVVVASTNVFAAPSEIDVHITTVRTFVQRGDCAAARALAEQIRALNPARFEAFAPELGACRPPPPRAEPARPRPPGYKSPLIAIGVPLLVTALGFGLFAAVPQAGAPFVLVGPSVGRIYIGRPLGMGLLARTIGLGLIGLGFGLADSRGLSANPRSQKAVETGLLLVVAGSLYEIVSAPIYAVHDNERRYDLMPTPMPGGAGLALRMEF